MRKKKEEKENTRKTKIGGGGERGQKNKAIKIRVVKRKGQQARKRKGTKEVVGEQIE